MTAREFEGWQFHELNRDERYGSRGIGEYGKRCGRRRKG